MPYSVAVQCSIEKRSMFQRSTFNVQRSMFNVQSGKTEDVGRAF